MRSPGLRFLFLLPVALTLTLAGSTVGLVGSTAADLPAKLTDQEFWKLSEDLSEPDGSFQSDNLLSNEIVFARLVPQLIAQTKPGGVYLGVGPEQNFTYMAAIRPRMAFITDIRRGNLHMQLMYKALFELSADRAEFVSRLFTKPRPAGLTSESTVRQLMDAYWEARTADEAAYSANLDAINRHLTKTHTLPLSADDLDGIARVYRTFYWYGPAMNYSASTSLNMVGAGRGTTYWDLMTQSDASGLGYSYLGSEEKFTFLKGLQARNLVVPVVGNFAGPKALRAVGTYLKQHGGTVTAFYLSNVESYLRRANTWTTFCANVATMPLDDASVFIRPSGGAFVGPISFAVRIDANGNVVRTINSTTTSTPGPTASGLVPMAGEVKACGG